MPTDTQRLGPFLPDVPILGSPGSAIIKNVIPKAKGSYTPFRRIASFSEALELPALAMRFARSSSGTIFGFAFTQDRISRLNQTQFENASRAAGYNTPDDGIWDIVQFEDLIFATNFADAVQEFDLNFSGDFDDNTGTIPQAKYVTVSGNFLLVAHYNELGSLEPSAVRWSSNNSPRDFPAVGTDDALSTLSDRRRLNRDYGEITGIESGVTGANVVVLQERAIWRSDFVRGRTIFSFDEIEAARGCNSPGSVINVGGLVYFLDESGIYRTDGVNVEPIGQSRIDDFFYRRIDVQRLAKVVSGEDVRNKVVYWALPPIDDTQNSLTILYNYDIDEFSFAEGQTVQAFTRTISTGFTLTSLAQEFGELRNIPGSTDDPAFAGGGLPVFSGFDEDNRLGSFTGQTLEAQMRTPEVNPGKGRRIFIEYARPLIDTDQATVAAVLRDRTQDGPVLTEAKPIVGDGRCPIRRKGRYAAMELAVPAGADWSIAQGVQTQWDITGERQPTGKVVAKVGSNLIVTTEGLIILTDEGEPCQLNDPPVVVIVEVFTLITNDGDSIVTDDDQEIEVFP